MSRWEKRNHQRATSGNGNAASRRPSTRTPKSTSGINPSGWYERCAIVYAENYPTEGYMDILARQAIAGNRQAQEELNILMAGIAQFASAKYRNIGFKWGLERDDLRQSAMSEMLAGLHTWQPDKLSFKLHAYNQARKGVVRLLQIVTPVPYATYKAAMGEVKRGRNEPKAHTRSAVMNALREPLSFSEAPTEGDEEPAYWLGRHEKDYDEVVTHLSIEQALRVARVTPEQQTALEALYGDKGSQQQRIKDLAVELGVSENSVRHTARRALFALQTTNAPLVHKSNTEVEEKTCRDCGETKPVSEFYRRSNGNGPQTACKKCNVARSVRNKQKRREENRRGAQS